jgi:hypothetical protein
MHNKPPFGYMRPWTTGPFFLFRASHIYAALTCLNPYAHDIYIDGIQIFSKTEAEHQAHVPLVLEVLKREKSYVCRAKSSFAQIEIN